MNFFYLILKLNRIIMAGFFILLIYSCTAEGAWDLLREIDQAVTVSFQEGTNGYTGTKDAHLVEYHSDNNTGSHDRIEATRHTGVTPTDNKAIVIEFDLSSIPSTATILSADLALFLIEQRNGSFPKTLNVHKITVPWIEGTGLGIDGQNVPGVDWLSMPAFDIHTLDNKLIEIVVDTWYTFSITSAVQSWVDSPSSNYGIILMEDIPIASNGSKVFASSEHVISSSRPELIVSYTN